MSAAVPPRVVVVLVNWNNHGDTLECLESLCRSTYEPREVIVVDNGSRPESVDALRGGTGGALLIESPVNLGFTGGNNLGIRTALDRHADLVFVLNNDTTVHPETISLLVGALEAEPRAGIAAPKVRFFPPEDLIWYAGGAFSELTQNPVMRGYRQADDGRWDEPGEVEFASGCAMLIRRGLLERLGGFSDEYFAVWEDVDLSRRARSAGYRILYVPGAVVWHKESASVGGNDAPRFVYYQVRNRFLFLRRWARGPLIPVSAGLFAAAHLTKRSLAFALHRRWGALAAIGAGIAHGLAGRGGPR